MNILYKVAFIAIFFLLFSVILKNHRPEYVFLLRLVGIASIFFISIDYIVDFIESCTTLFSSFNLESSHLSLLLKIIAITLISDFISDTLSDNGESAMANVVIVLSKFIIIFYTLPVLNGIIIFCLKFIDL